ncbi:hypothetical protein D3C84_510550 [compost metagenome]
MQQLDTGQASGIPRAFVEQFRCPHRNQQLGKQPHHFPVRRKVPIAKQYRTIKGLMVEIDMIDIHPGAGQLHLIARL